MDTDFFVLSPIEVVKVTPENLAEVAEWCGGQVATTESRRVAGRMDSYVWVPTPKGSNTSWAFPGMFVTKRCVISVKNEIKFSWAVYRRDYFEKNYFPDPLTALDKTWDRAARENVKAQKPNNPARIRKASINKDSAKYEKVFVDGAYQDRLVEDTDHGPRLVAGPEETDSDAPMVSAPVRPFDGMETAPIVADEPSATVDSSLEITQAVENMTPAELEQVRDDQGNITAKNVSEVVDGNG